MFNKRSRLLSENIETLMKNFQTVVTPLYENRVVVVASSISLGRFREFAIHHVAARAYSSMGDSLCNPLRIHIHVNDD